MISTKMVWCDKCKLRVFECEHLDKTQDATKPDDGEFNGMNVEIRNRALRLKPLRRRLSYLTFAKVLAAGQTDVITVFPQLVFKPLRLVVDPLIAPYFTFIDVRIGHQIVGAALGQGVRCTVFPADPLDKMPVNNLEGVDTCQVAQWFGLHVLNNDQGSVHGFSAIVWGETVS